MKTRAGYVIRHESRERYSPPLSKEEMEKAGYGSRMIDALMNDAVHGWRAETGIELIHLEPTFKEQMRIWKNWCLMPEELQKKSNEKAIELFGVPNEEMHLRCLDEWMERQFNEKEHDEAIF